MALEFSEKSDEISFHEIQKLDSVFGHLLRNSLDHGIESPEDRESEGKKKTGKAVLKNIWSAERAKTASKDEALNLIFLSDFSTKEVISETSGQGVGMDAVRADVENLGGKIQLQTEIKKGTRFTIVIPT